MAVDFTLPPDVEAVRQRVRDFMDGEVRPAEEKLYANAAPAEPERRDTVAMIITLREKAKEWDIWLPHMPEEWGGLGLGPTAMAFVSAEAARTMFGPFVLNAQAPDEGNQHTLLHHASDEQKEKYLRPLTEGFARSCFAMTEPEVAGSDPTGIRTTAVLDEAADEWVINGQKAWATNGGIADVHVVIASVDRELGSRGHAAFIVPPGTKGLEQGAKVRKHGIRASHTADVHLDDCRVPGSCLLGGKEKLDERLARVREGKRGNSQAAMQTFEASRPTVGAQAIGIARAAYEYSLDYAKERRQFGKAIIENQAIAFTLANMKIEIDAARLLVWRAAWMGRNQIPFTNAEGSMSKVKAGEVATWVTERAIQILGGNGYTREFPVERMHRDAKIYDIFEGTAEIQRLVISRAISGVHVK
jgi:acyl-CoA dehydrogenase